MTFKRYDVITFEENDKVVVLEALVHEGNEYVYVNEILPDESERLFAILTSIFKTSIRVPLSLKSTTTNQSKFQELKFPRVSLYL